MNFPSSDLLLSRQRCRQWIPLLTQQLRLRHVTQVIAYNIMSKKFDSFYFTFHQTSMSAPFFTSERIVGPYLKWTDLDTSNLVNLSASALVLRIWQHRNGETDKIVLTWGINFSGLVSIGSKIADIQPFHFNNNTVIFYMQGSYFTSQYCIRTDLQKPLPFLESLNIKEDAENKKIYRYSKIKSSQSEIIQSYNLEKLRKLQTLQISIKNKINDVQNIKGKIDLQKGLNNNVHTNEKLSIANSSLSSNIRYEPQLLTMNSLNKMLQDKPTTLQIQEMMKINKELEVARFRVKLLSHEKEQKSLIVQKLRQKLLILTEENEERNTNLMDNYHFLSKESEKLRELKRSLMHHYEIFRHLNMQLHYRKQQLLQQLLFIYPITKVSENKYLIHNIYLPYSDILADCSDFGLSVALGYVSHILTMCSTFLQVPLRYPITHYGSRSYITDNTSPSLADKDREFPLFSRGKEKMQFTYAVYLLNKNIAQLRWLYYMPTQELKATLPNLLSFLQGPKERPDLAFKSEYKSLERGLDYKHPVPSNFAHSNDNFVSLNCFGSNSNICDPILDSIRHENRLRRSQSPNRSSHTNVSTSCKNSQCGRGLSEILTIPEAYLNKQISKDSFRNYVLMENYGRKCCGESSKPPLNSTKNFTNNLTVEEVRSCDNTMKDHIQLTNADSIEEGTDPLDPSTNLTSIISKSIKIHSNRNVHKGFTIESDLKQSCRISRSAGSYTDDEASAHLRLGSELCSEPLLNKQHDMSEGQQEFLKKWLKNGPKMVCSEEDLYHEDICGSSTEGASHSKPLTARTDALLNTNSFNLVKPKQ